MSAFTKISLGILLLIFVVLGVEGFLYFQVSNKPRQNVSRPPVLSPTPSSSQNAASSLPSSIDITGQVTLLGNLNLADIGKDEVSGWTKQNGIITVPAYSGPLPTVPPGIPLPSGLATPSAATQRPTSVKVLAGVFNSIGKESIVLSQGGETFTITFNSGARLWIKAQNKLSLVSSFLNTLLTSGSFSQFVQPGDLVLAINVSGTSGQIVSSGLVVFK